MFKFEFRWEGVWQIEGFDFLVVADGLHGGRNSKTVMSRFLEKTKLSPLPVQPPSV